MARPATRHQIGWVAAALRRATADQGVELPVAYARRVATEGLARGAELGVTRLGAGVVIHTSASSKDRLPIVIGYADPRGQWHRDGARHIETPPAESSAVDGSAVDGRDRGGGAVKPRQSSDLVAVPERFVLRPWTDVLVEARGFPVSSMYTEAVLLPILGPSSVLCPRRPGSLAAARPERTEVDTARLARDLGLGDGLGRHSQITRTLGRLCGFGMARWSDVNLEVRTAVAPVPERHLRRLSPELVGLHHCMLR
jgi:hypothetical protein